MYIYRWLYNALSKFARRVKSLINRYRDILLIAFGIFLVALVTNMADLENWIMVITLIMTVSIIYKILIILCVLVFIGFVYYVLKVALKRLKELDDTAEIKRKRENENEHRKLIKAIKKVIKDAFRENREKHGGKE